MLAVYVGFFISADKSKVNRSIIKAVFSVFKFKSFKLKYFKSLKQLSWHLMTPI